MSIDFAVADGIASSPSPSGAAQRDGRRALPPAVGSLDQGPRDAAIRVAIITVAGEKSFTAGRRHQELSHPAAGRRDVADPAGSAPQPRPGDLEADHISSTATASRGMTLMLATDIRVAAEHAIFGLSR